MSVEEKIAKVKEILGEDEKALDAYVKEKGYHTNPAWQKQREIIDRLKMEKDELLKKGSLSEEVQRKLEEFNRVTSSPEYIQASMKAQGYTQDAINAKLREIGVEVPNSPDTDLDLLGRELQFDPKTLGENEKALVQDVVKIVDVMFKNRMSKMLPEQLRPIEEHITTVRRSQNADKLISTMKGELEADGVLDFGKDVEPILNDFLDKNPEATQEDLYAHFKEIKYGLTVQALKSGKKQVARDVKKGNLRQNLGGGNQGRGFLPEKTGDFDKDADTLLDQLGVS